MPAALSMEIRQEVVSRREEGESFVKIANELAISYDGARQIWRHWQKYKQLEPRYEACSRRGIRYMQAVYERAIELKQVHQKWGAQVIRIQLCDEFEDKDVPQIRTLQSWFRQAGVSQTANVRQKKSH